jgi:hypothetical protein
LKVLDTNVFVSGFWRSATPPDYDALMPVIKPVPHRTLAGIFEEDGFTSPASAATVLP